MKPVTVMMMPSTVRPPQNQTFSPALNRPLGTCEFLREQAAEALDPAQVALLGEVVPHEQDEGDDDRQREHRTDEVVQPFETIAIPENTL